MEMHDVILMTFKQSVPNMYFQHDNISILQNMQTCGRVSADQNINRFTKLMW